MAKLAFPLGPALLYFDVFCCVPLHVRGQLAKRMPFPFKSMADQIDLPLIAAFLEVVICWWRVM